MDDLKNITIASTIVIGISKHAQKFGLDKKYIPLLNLASSILVSFLFVGFYNIRDLIAYILFLTITSSGMHAGMNSLGKKISKLKKN